MKAYVCVLWRFQVPPEGRPPPGREQTGLACQDQRLTAEKRLGTHMQIMNEDLGQKFQPRAYHVFMIMRGN